jgi:HlyD family secretion protein
MGQPAEVSIDAIPRKVFHGTVTEIGDNAIVRSTGVSTSQATSTSEEAKDFKVVVTLSDPPSDLRPGLSVTAKITTATRNNVVSVPIQALTVRNAADLVPKDAHRGSVEAAAPAPVSAAKSKEEIQGVFVIRNKKAEFVPVDTGISGTTDIEVMKGLKEGDEVITGSYKVLRTLKPGTSVKIDNSTPSKEESS